MNFAHIIRVTLLGTLFPHRQWCATIANECIASADVLGMSDLDNAHGVFGPPMFPDSVELIDARVLRQAMARPGEGPHEHLGEAETVAIVARRQIDAVFVTDDQAAQSLAQAQGIRVIHTWRVIQLAHKAGLLTADEVWADCHTLESNQRGWPPCGRSRAAFDAWLLR